MKWACGMTTVWQRGKTYYPVAMQSVINAGWEPPHVFIDEPRIGTFGRWYLGLLELWIRHPDADAFVMFQDDIELCRNVRPYIERTGIPDNTYLNLVTHPLARDVAPPTPAGRSGEWFTTRPLGHGGARYPLPNGLLQQAGKGACALVFPRASVEALLKADRMIRKPSEKYGTCNLDGAIVESMNAAGYQEMAHSPSLGRHIGTVTSMPGLSIVQPQSLDFPGTHFDANAPL